MDTTLTKLLVDSVSSDASQSYLKLDTTLTATLTAEKTTIQVSVLPKIGYHSDWKSQLLRFGIRVSQSYLKLDTTLTILMTIMSFD